MRRDETMAPNVVRISPSQIRVRINRLPFFTRTVFLIALAFWILSIPLSWIPAWAALTPSKVGLMSMHRLNTFPVTHAGLLHMILGLAALTPLLERFEAEHGTLVSLALFAGPFATLPGGIYILIDHIVLRKDTSVEGASVWIFLLLACESARQYRVEPNIDLGAYKVPVWTYPLVLLFFFHFLLISSTWHTFSTTTVLIDLCGATVGYLFGLGFLKILVPPEGALRFIEGKLNLLGRLPHYVSVDQKTYGRYGVLPSSDRGDVSPSPTAIAGPSRGIMADSSAKQGP